MALALARRPTALQAACAADRQRALRNRLATAVEIIEGRVGGLLSELQLADTRRVAMAVSASAAFPRSDASARRSLCVGVAALAVALAATVWLSAREQPIVVPAPISETLPTPIAIAVLSPQELAQVRARSTTEQAAIAQLADQLRRTAAARDVGQALQRGEVTVAAALLRQLAQDSDQLSQASKQELAGALLNAAKGTAALDKNLAAAELSATQAMTRADYQAARNALQGLAAAMLSAQSGTLTQAQLVQQIQQFERESGQPGNGADCGVLTDDGEFFQDCSAVGQSPSYGGMGVVSRGAGESPAAGTGEVAGGHGFATSGVNLDPFGQTPTHVDRPVADVPVDVPLSNAQGNGNRSERPTAAISQAEQRDVTQRAGPQSSEPLTTEPERTTVGPSERAIVRDFFQPRAGP